MNGNATWHAGRDPDPAMSQMGNDMRHEIERLKDENLRLTSQLAIAMEALGRVAEVSARFSKK
jgi:hypothetical protein